MKKLVKSTRAFAAYFLIAGLLVLSVVHSAEAACPTPVTVENARTCGLWWLLTHQNGDGSWKSTAGTEFLATSDALQALAAAGLKNFIYASGLAWLSNAPANSVDSLSRQIIAINQAGVNVTPYLSKLIRWFNYTGAWGAYDQFETSFPDTPLALSAILNASYPTYTDYYLTYAVCGILPVQKADGSWSFIFPSSTPPASQAVNAILPTTYNILALNTINATRFTSATCWTPPINNSSYVSYTLLASINSGISWLLTKKNADGGFGDNGVSTVFETALAYQVLAFLRPADPATRGALDYLISRQNSADGSWNGDAVQTAFVMKLLPSPAAPLVDTDRDGIPDAVELLMGTNPNVPDSRFLAKGGGLALIGVTAPTVLATAFLNQAFSVTLPPSSGPAPYTWLVISGSLPPGLALNTSTGLISGTPTTLGSYSFAYSIIDSTSSMTTAVAQIDVVRSDPSVATGDLNGDGIVDAADVSLAERIAVGLETPTPTQLSHGDVSPPGNPNGVIDAADVARIRLKALGFGGF